MAMHILLSGCVTLFKAVHFGEDDGVSSRYGGLWKNDFDAKAQLRASQASQTWLYH